MFSALKIDLKRLHYFQTIVEQGQISRAAKVLHMSQPPLSQRLKELEEDLGVQLIIRSGGQWQVTDSGRLLYERARQLLTNIGNLTSEVRNAANGYSGRVHIGISTTCLSLLRAPLVVLQRGHPKLRYRIITADSNKLEHYVKEGIIDFAILLLPVEDTVYEIIHLPEQGPTVVFSEHFKTPGGKTMLECSDLEGIPLLALRRDEGGGIHDQLFKHIRLRGVTPNIILECSDIRVIISLLSEGVRAASLLPGTEVPPTLRPRLPMLPLNVGGIVIQPVIIRLRERFLTSAAHQVIDTIQEHSGCPDAFI